VYFPKLDYVCFVGLFKQLFAPFIECACLLVLVVVEHLFDGTSLEVNQFQGMPMTPGVVF
jgi:hypothetical protein